MIEQRSLESHNYLIQWSACKCDVFLEQQIRKKTICMSDLKSLQMKWKSNANKVNGF